MKAKSKVAPLTKFDHAAHSRKLAKRPGSHWRFQTGGSFQIKPRGGDSVSERFDEVVVDDWLHAEMMDTRSVFITVAGLALWLHLTPKGAVVTHAELRDHVPSDGMIKALRLALASSPRQGASK